MSGFDIDEEPSLKLIVTKYDGRCTSCGRDLPAGSSAYYGKKTNGESVLLCTVCTTDTGGEQALARKYRKVRELNIVIKDLSKKANELSDLVSDLESEENLKDMAIKIDVLLRQLSDYIAHIGLGAEERNDLEAIMAFLKSVQDEWVILRNIIQSRVPLKKQRMVVASI